MYCNMYILLKLYTLVYSRGSFSPFRARAVEVYIYIYIDGELFNPPRRKVYLPSRVPLERVIGRGVDREKAEEKQWKTNNLCWTGRFCVYSAIYIIYVCACVSRRGRARKGPFSIKIPVLER